VNFHKVIHNTLHLGIVEINIPAPFIPNDEITSIWLYNILELISIALL